MILHRDLQSVLNKTIRIGDTKYQCSCYACFWTTVSCRGYSFVRLWVAFHLIKSPVPRELPSYQSSPKQLCNRKSPESEETTCQSQKRSQTQRETNWIVASISQKGHVHFMVNILRLERNSHRDTRRVQVGAYFW